jgi:AbiV family abortive infection protein
LGKIAKFNERDRIVKRAEMSIGIETCKENIRQFLKDAKLLMDTSTLSHAYISVQYSMEELGKILILRQKLVIDKSDPLIITHREAFKSHEGKTEEALLFLGSGYDKIFDEGVFEEGCVEKGLAVMDTFVKHETRLDCAFVDYYGGMWQNGRDIRKELLVKLINRIEEKLPDA